MRIHQQAFSAHVELPCKIFCGPDSLLEIAGMAMKIGAASMHLELGSELGSWKPVVGEQLRVELLLPVNWDQAGARNLSVRARVAEIVERPDGTQALELRFRKPVFKDRGSRNEAAAPLRETANGGAVKWTM
jgi:hypothetical protein